MDPGCDWSDPTLKNRIRIRISRKTRIIPPSIKRTDPDPTLEEEKNKQISTLQKKTPDPQLYFEASINVRRSILQAAKSHAGMMSDFFLIVDLIQRAGIVQGD